MDFSFVQQVIPSKFWRYKCFCLSMIRFESAHFVIFYFCEHCMADLPKNIVSQANNLVLNVKFCVSVKGEVAHATKYEY